MRMKTMFGRDLVAAAGPVSALRTAASPTSAAAASVVPLKITLRRLGVYPCDMRPSPLRANPEREPDVPAVRPVLGGKFAVTLQVQITLNIVGDGKEIADLRTNARDSRFEIAEPRPGTAIAADLLVQIADEADLNVGFDEDGRAQIQMKIETAAIIRVRIFKIVS